MSVVSVANKAGIENGTAIFRLLKICWNGARRPVGITAGPPAGNGHGSRTGEEQERRREAACAAGWPGSVREIRNNLHARFRAARRFWGGGMRFTVPAKLCERVAPGQNVVVKGSYVPEVAYFAELDLPGIARDRIPYPP